MSDHDQPAPRWETPAGTIVGWRDGPVLRATGVRYATAARHRPPVDEPPAVAPIDATGWGPACPQPPVPFLEEVLGGEVAGRGHDEDCQRLSVTVPADVGADEALPVIVWIHGGSYASGAGDTPLYDPVAIVSEQRVVVVTVTYRLGLLGYLGSPDGPPANLGLVDQVSALRWVRRTIASFGGDPDLVTVAGQSAGGDAAAHLMVARGAEGLFRRVVVQSAPFGISRGRAPMAAAMAAEAAAVPLDAPVADVVAAQPGVVARAQSFGLVASMPFGTQYGFDPLPAEDDVDEAWRRIAPDIDVLVGCTDREAAFFVSVVPLVARLVRLPLVGRVVRSLFVRVLTRKVYAAGAEELLARHRAAGGRGYRYTLTFGAAGNPWAGAHTADLPLLLGTRETWEAAPLLGGQPWAEVDAAGRELRALWARFARTGELDPGVRPGLVTISAT